MRLVLVVAVAATVLAYAVPVAADMKTQTVSQYELKKDILCRSSGTRMVTIASLNRTEVRTYAVTEDDGDVPVQRCVTTVDQSEKAVITTTTVETHKDKDFVVTGRTTVVKHTGAGVTETVVEDLVDDQLTPCRRIVVTVQSSPGVSDTTTTTEERKDGVMLQTQELRVLKVDYNAVLAARLLEQQGIQNVSIEGQGVYLINVQKTLVDGSLKITNVRVQIDQAIGDTPSTAAVN